MGYGRSYGMSGTAVPEWQQGLKKCKETMSCTAGRCMSYDGASNKCTCEKCSSLMVNGSKPGITPRYDSNDTRPAVSAFGGEPRNPNLDISRRPCPTGYEKRCIDGRCGCVGKSPDPTPYVGVRGVNGLGESFLESLGSIANLAIIGLAIYGGYCLAKKI